MGSTSLLKNFPNKRYNLIYIDPPWPVKKIPRRVRPNQVEMDYKTMSVEEINRIPVASICDYNCVCFLWTVQKYLREAFTPLDLWGFKYQRTITWDKKNGMCLFGFHHRTEFCLFGYKGKIEMYPRRKAVPTLWEEKSSKHSKKPDTFRKAIEVFGDKRIELFARSATEGWDVWGDEIDADSRINKA